jgi:hypothetical protein
MARSAGRCFRQRFHIDAEACNILQLFARHSSEAQSSRAA